MIMIRCHEQDRKRYRPGSRFGGTMKAHQRFSFLLILCGVVLASNTARATEAKPAHPNILWLIAEDMDPHLGCYGTKEVWTPNLDQLAAEGVRFTRAFT